MAKRVRMHEIGGPGVLQLESYDPEDPPAGEVRIRHEAVGLNFIDVYHRTGLYPLPSLPATPGMEGAGVVEAVGDDVDGFAEGDRVAYAAVPPGAYADIRNIPAHRLVHLPEAISFQDASAMMLQGMTARYLLKGCYPVRSESRILVHAAAGGVGSILCQWAKHLGASVIGTVGSAEKAERARANGCDHPIVYTEQDFVAKVREFTAGAGVDVVYDSVGQATFLRSMDCIRPMGTLVSFGQASGSVEPLDIGLLSAKGSLFLTRPTLMTYTEKRTDLLDHAHDLFEVVQNGAVQIQAQQIYDLENVAQAHRDLESRKTVGSTILIP